MKNDFFDDFAAFNRHIASLLSGVKPIDYCGTNFQKLDAIGQYYRALENEIINHHKTRPNQSYRAYAFNWNSIFNVVEKMAWDCIRTKGNMPLYPQYPVLNYFLDFGNPIHKIGFEVDGKKWHNLENDISRDKKLKTEGWTIYRVSGKEMMRTNYKEYFELNFDEDYSPLSGDNYWQMGHWLTETGDGVLEALKIKYFTGLDGYHSNHHAIISQLVEQTLEEHVII